MGDAPKATSVSAGASFAAQRTANTAAGDGSLSTVPMGADEIADACAAWKVIMQASPVMPLYLLSYHQGDDD
jgi:hypothetical protein